MLNRRELFAAVGGLVLSPTLLESLAVAEETKHIIKPEKSNGRIIYSYTIAYTVLREQDPDLLYNYGPQPHPIEHMYCGYKKNILKELKLMVADVHKRTGKIAQDNYIVFYQDNDIASAICSFYPIKWLAHYKICGKGKCHARISS